MRFDLTVGLLHRTVPLIDALTGVSLRITALDGRILHAQAQPGAVVRPGDHWILPECGLPIPQRLGSERYGHMFVEFEVELPESLPLQSKENIQQLEHLLGQRRGQSVANGNGTGVFSRWWQGGGQDNAGGGAKQKSDTAVEARRATASEIREMRRAQQTQQSERERMSGFGW